MFGDFLVSPTAFDPAFSFLAAFSIARIAAEDD